MDSQRHGEPSFDQMQAVSFARGMVMEGVGAGVLHVHHDGEPVIGIQITGRERGHNHPADVRLICRPVDLANLVANVYEIADHAGILDYVDKQSESIRADIRAEAKQRVDQAPSSLDLGRTAFQGYAEATKGKSFTGQILLPWQQLPDAIQLAWASAATAVMMNHVRKEATDRPRCLANVPQGPLDALLASEPSLATVVRWMCMLPIGHDGDHDSGDVTWPRPVPRSIFDETLTDIPVNLGGEGGDPPSGDDGDQADATTPEETRASA